MTHHIRYIHPFTQMFTSFYILCRSVFFFFYWDRSTDWFLFTFVCMNSLYLMYTSLKIVIMKYMNYLTTFYPGCGLFVVKCSSRNIWNINIYIITYIYIYLYSKSFIYIGCVSRLPVSLSVFFRISVDIPEFIIFFYSLSKLSLSFPSSISLSLSFSLPYFSLSPSRDSVFCLVCVSPCSLSPCCTYTCHWIGVCLFVSVSVYMWHGNVSKLLVRCILGGTTHYARSAARYSYVIHSSTFLLFLFFILFLLFFDKPSIFFINWIISV